MCATRISVAVISQITSSCDRHQPQLLAIEERSQHQEKGDQQQHQLVARVRVSRSFMAAISDSSAVPASTPFKVRKSMKTANTMATTATIRNEMLGNREAVQADHDAPDDEERKCAQHPEG